VLRKKVRCIDCGFLCFYERRIGGQLVLPGLEQLAPVTHHYFEVALELRQSAKSLQDLSRHLLCYRGIVSPGPEDEEVVRKITTTRACSYFVEHIPGFDPTWHLTEHERKREQGAIRRWNLLSNLLSVLLGIGVTILVMWLTRLWFQ